MGSWKNRGGETVIGENARLVIGLKMGYSTDDGQ